MQQIAGAILIGLSLLSLTVLAGELGGEWRLITLLLCGVGIMGGVLVMFMPQQRP